MGISKNFIAAGAYKEKGLVPGSKGYVKIAVGFVKNISLDSGVVSAYRVLDDPYTKKTTPIYVSLMDGSAFVAEVTKKILEQIEQLNVEDLELSLKDDVFNEYLSIKESLRKPKDKGVVYGGASDDHESADGKLSFSRGFTTIFYAPNGMDFMSDEVIASQSGEYYLTFGSTKSRECLLFVTKEALLWKKNAASFEFGYVFDDGRSLFVIENDDGSCSITLADTEGSVLNKMKLEYPLNKYSFDGETLVAEDEDYRIEFNTSSFENTKTWIGEDDEEDTRYIKP
jgi:hypothetical protein